MDKFLDSAKVSVFPTLLVITGPGKTAQITGARTFGEYARFVEEVSDISVRVSAAAPSPFPQRIEAEKAISASIGGLRIAAATSAAPIPAEAIALANDLAHLREHSVKNGAQTIPGTQVLQLLHRFDNVYKFLNEGAVAAEVKGDSGVARSAECLAAARQILMTKAQSGAVAVNDYAAYLRMFEAHVESMSLALTNSEERLPAFTKMLESRSPSVSFMFGRAGMTSSAALKTEYLKALNLREGEAVAYVGVGKDAERSINLARAVGSRGKVILTDVANHHLWEPEMVALQASYNVKLEQGTEADTKLGKETMNAIYMRDTFHHLDDPAAIMKSMYSNLKPGGRLVIEDMSYPGHYLDPTPVQTQKHAANPVAIIDLALKQGFRWTNSLTEGDKTYTLVFVKPGRK
jgi:ubiquinone/menaquinone biosynthesis C-methylase UbiE